MNGLATVLRAIGRRSRGRSRAVTWFGSKVCDLDSDQAVAELALVLYRWAYTVGAPTPREPDEPAGPDERWSELSDLTPPAVRAAWGGWRALSSTTVGFDGQPVVTLTGHHGPSGREVDIPLPVLSGSVLPGWVVLRHGDVRDVRPAHRLYVNTSPEPLMTAVTGITRFLASEVAGSSAKFLATYDHQARADSTVIYLPRVPSGHILGRLIAILGPTVHRPATPLFTHRLADGIAYARSPAGGDSFGMAVCTSIAEGVLDSLRRGHKPSPERVRTTAASLMEAPPTVPDRPRRAATPPSPAGGPSVSEVAVAALQELASRLGREALTADGHVTWLGPPGSTRETLGGDVYGGLAGPLLVLAHSVAITDDASSRRLLAATARTMLARQPELPSLGFHAGQPGTTAALTEAALISQLPELADLASASLSSTLRSLNATDLDSTREWDVVGGVSGAVIALAYVATGIGRPLDHVIEGLVGALARLHEIDPKTGTVRWRLRTGRRSATLAGLAHGGTGAALALVAARPSDPRLLELAQRSIQFEDRCCTDGRGWTDRRFRPLSAAASAWCHGAAGIGIGTAAILRHDLPDEWRPQLAARIDKAAMLTTEATEVAVADDGLCHGLSGRLLALLIMGERPGSTPPHAPFPTDHDDLSLMTGEPGRVVAALAMAGLARAPIAVSLSPVQLPVLRYA